MTRPFRHAGLYQKLLAGYLALMALMLLPSAFSLYLISRIEGVAVNLSQNDIDISTSIESLKSIVPTLEAEARRLISLQREDALVALSTAAQDFRTHLARIERKESEPFILFTNEIENLLTDLLSIASRSRGEMTREPSANEERMPEDLEGEIQVKKISMEIMTMIAMIEKAHTRKIYEETSSISRQSARAWKLAFLSLLASLVFTLIAPLYLRKNLKKPMDCLREGMKRIGAGDFDSAIPVTSDDEIGELSRAFNDMTAKLKEIDLLKSEFIAVTSHELRTPLTSMVEAGKLLAEPGIGPLNDKQEKLVSILNESLHRFHDLVDALLHLSRLKAGMIPLEKRPIELISLFRDAARSMDPMILSKGITVSCETAGDDDWVLADYGVLYRAILNVLQNAVKYSGKRSTIRIAVIGTEKTDGLTVRAAIVDEGPGIPHEDLERIFDKFYQIQGARKKDGVGLGLAIAREIIALHNGRIWVESPPDDEIAVSPGLGAAFWIQLPAAPVQEK